MRKIEKRIVLAAGGTGGHVFPAIALAHELSQKGYKVFLLTDGRGHQFHDSEISIQRIPAASLQGGIVNKFHGGVTVLRGIGSALIRLRRLSPSVVVGFGGYASFPTIVAAQLLRIRTIIHQADAYFGRTNRLLATHVTRIATSFPHVENIPEICRNKVSFTGLPLRSDIQPFPYVPSKENEPFHLLVTGGSQGARIFGEIISQAIGRMDPSFQKRLHITQQCREENLTKTKALYEKTKATVSLSPFLESMGEHYKRAHFIISRAGASSVAEAALVGRPALFIPYPQAMDNHQYYNAQQAVDGGGGWLMLEKEFTSQTLADLLEGLMKEPKVLEEAATSIRRIAIPDAVSRFEHLVTLVMKDER